MLGLFRMYCFVCCDWKRGRLWTWLLDSSECTAVSVVAEKRNPMELALGQFRMCCSICRSWHLDSSGCTVACAVAEKGNTMDYPGAWTIMDVLLCLLWPKREHGGVGSLDNLGCLAVSALAKKGT